MLPTAPFSISLYFAWVTNLLADCISSPNLDNFSYLLLIYTKSQSLLPSSASVFSNPVNEHCSPVFLVWATGLCSIFNSQSLLICSQLLALSWISLLDGPHPDPQLQEGPPPDSRGLNSRVHENPSYGEFDRTQLLDPVRVSDLGGLGWDPITDISRKISCNAEAANIENHILRTTDFQGLEVAPAT